MKINQNIMKDKYVSETSYKLYLRCKDRTKGDKC